MATTVAVTTPDSVSTRIGALTFERGFPTEETTRKVFDEIDYQRAVQAYLWANWIQTVPGKGWYPMFRFYTPKEDCSTARGSCRMSS